MHPHSYIENTIGINFWFLVQTSENFDSFYYQLSSVSNLRSCAMRIWSLNNLHDHQVWRKQLLFITHCVEILKNILPLRFYVKLIFGVPKVPKIAILIFWASKLRFWIWFFFFIFCGMKFFQLNPAPLKLRKWQFLKLQIGKIWFHVKSDW